jgi:nitroalkane oxidase
MAIDFTLTPRQRTIQRQSREFARDIIARANSAELLPTAEERFLATKPIYQAMVAAGFLRKCIPVQAGGESAGLVELAILAEEFYSINASVSLTLIGTLLGLLPILLGGSAEQRGRLLAPFLKTSGAPLAAFCATEPGGSANAASPPPGEGVRTTAKLEGDRWIIQGRKSWISSASGWDRKGANVLCVVCRTGSGGPPERSVSIIAVEHPAAGFVFEDAVDPVGHRAHFLPRFRFDDVSVPRGNLVGEEGGGFALTAASFTGAAALVGIFGVALMRAAFDVALQFSRTERRGGIHPAIEHQAVGFSLADAKTIMEATRCLAWRACHAVDEKSLAVDELAIQAKVFGSETAVRVISDLMRVVGVDSYDRECPLGRLLQDALALPLFGGGNVGVRRRQLHAILKRPDYDPFTEGRAA